MSEPTTREYWEAYKQLLAQGYTREQAKAILQKLRAR